MSDRLSKRLRAAASQLELRLAELTYRHGEIMAQTAALREEMRQHHAEFEAAALQVADLISKRMEVADRRADLALAPPGIVSALEGVGGDWWLELPLAAKELGRVLGKVWEPDAFRKAFARHGRPEWKRRGLLATQYNVTAIAWAIRRGEF